MVIAAPVYRNSVSRLSSPYAPATISGLPEPSKPSAGIPVSFRPDGRPTTVVTHAPVALVRYSRLAFQSAS